MTTKRKRPPYRWTAYSDGIPVGHGWSKGAALLDADRRLVSGIEVDALVRRMTEYPFTHVERVELPPTRIDEMEGKR